MMEEQNNNEVPTCESTTPQNPSAETTTVVSDTSNYTADKSKKQVTKNKNTIIAESRNFYRYNAFQHNLLAQRAKIQRIHNANHIYTGKNNGIYVLDDDLIKYAIQQLVPQFKLSEINEEFQQLSIATKISEVTESPYNFIAFNNGVYDILSKEFKEFSACTPADFVLLNKLGIDYADPNIVNDSADIALIHQVFYEITGGNEELIQYLLETFGECISRQNLEPMAVIFSGSSENINNDGRKVIIDVSTAILGSCVAHENLQDLVSGNSTMKLYTKTCNISNEQQKPKINNMDTLRDIIEGNEFTDQKSGLTFKPYTTMIFNINDILDFDNSLSGLKGYFKVIPFESKLTLDRPKLDILMNNVNLQYIVFKSLEAYLKILNSDSKKFNVPDIVERATNKYLLDSNSAREFIKIEPIFEVVEKRPYYDKYWSWCEANNKLMVSDAQFGKEILNCGYKCIRISVDGNRYNYYTVPNFNGNILRNKYLEYMLDKTNYTEVADDKFAVNKFIKAFADYFIDHSIDDEAYNIEPLTVQMDNGNLNIEDIADIPNKILADKEP